MYYRERSVARAQKLVYGTYTFLLIPFPHPRPSSLSVYPINSYPLPARLGTGTDHRNDTLPRYVSG